MVEITRKRVSVVSKRRSGFGQDDQCNGAGLDVAIEPSKPRRHRVW